MRTDHTALSYLHNFADNSRLMRRSHSLTEFDSVVGHKVGSKMGHMNAPSRHVSAVMDDGILNKERILQEQGKDTFCKEQKPGTYSTRREIFWKMMVLRIGTNLMKNTNWLYLRF